MKKYACLNLNYSGHAGMNIKKNIPVKCIQINVAWLKELVQIIKMMHSSGP